MSWLRRIARWVVWLLPLVLLLSGCKKKGDDYEEIGAPAVDVDELRRRAQEKKQHGGEPEPNRPADK